MTSRTPRPTRTTSATRRSPAAARPPSLERVLRRRLAAGRLSSAPLPSAGDAVRLLTCVQAQDAPLAAWSLGMRSRRRSYAGVLAEQATGAFVRTHVLRPTWHLVAPEDLRWLQAVTAPKVIRGLAGRHRQLELTGQPLEQGVEAVIDALTQRRPLTRKEIHAHLRSLGLGRNGSQAGHTLMVAELRALVCSGPPRGTEHTYVLVDDAIARHDADTPEPDEGIARLVERFVRGHGPVSAADLHRWCGVTLAELGRAAAVLGDRLDRVEVDGEQLWVLADASPPRATRMPEAMLLSTFDEVTLTYPRSGFPRAGDGDRTRLVSESGGGIVVVGLTDIGRWRRTVSRASRSPGRSGGGPAGAVHVDVMPDLALDADSRQAVSAAAQRLADFLELSLELTVHP